MSSEPPSDDEGRRPPISSLDEPIDDSGADEVERKRAERRNQSALPVAAVEALKLRALGFSILPLPTNQKFPPPKDWAKASNNNPAVFLTNPGTHNYAILPPPGCFGWDVDKDVPQLIESVKDTLGVYLPDTLMTMTPNGTHWFFRWPGDLPRPKGPMFGSVVTRWPLDDEGQGYLVGPGSVVVQENGTLGQYAMFGMEDDEPIADLPREWAEAALNWKPRREVKASTGPLAEVGPHYELPVAVSAGMRYESIRSYTAHLYNRGLSSNEMWPLVQAELAPKFDEALSLRELRDRFERAVRDIAERLGEPKALHAVPDFVASEAASSLGVGDEAEHSDPSQVPLGPTPLFVALSDIISELEAGDPTQWLIDGWVAAGGLTWWAGQPKSMKSMAVLQMLGAFVAGGEWMGKESLPDVTRVAVYVTREGSRADMLNRLYDVRDRHGPVVASRFRVAYLKDIDFGPAAFKAVASQLAFIEQEMSVLADPLQVLLVFDPLRDFLLPEWDENDARVMGAVKRWARDLMDQFEFLSVVIVHHLRKSAGYDGGDGLDMSGSGAGYAAGDGTVAWSSKRDDVDDDDDADDAADSGRLVLLRPRYGRYKVEPRGGAIFKGKWMFDAERRLFVRQRGVVIGSTGRAVAGTRSRSLIEIVIGAGRVGSTVADLAEEIGSSAKSVRTMLRRLELKDTVVESGGRWYARGYAPAEIGGLLDATAEEVQPRAADRDDADAGGDGEVWIDPLHSLDS